MSSLFILVISYTFQCTDLVYVLLNLSLSISYFDDLVNGIVLISISKFSWLVYKMQLIFKNIVIVSCSLSM